MRAGLLLLALAGGAAAAAPAADRIDSCVSDDALVLDAAEPHAWLDAADLTAAQLALVDRFPALARDGFAASRMLLWRRRGTWIYVAVAEAADGSAPCFTATVSAGALTLTPALLRKYFSGA